MIDKPVCPYCHAHYLVWDDEMGQLYCSVCDMYFSDDELVEFKKRDEETFANSYLEAIQKSRGG